MHKSLIILALLLGSSLLQSQKNDTSNIQPNELYPSGEIVSKYHNDWTRTHYQKRIQDFKNAQLEMHDIVFIGNSITEKGGDWSKKFGISHIRNRGISGDVTDGVLKRLDEVTHFKPRAVFILIGINDLFNLHHEKGGRSNLKYFEIVPSTQYVAKNILKIAKTIHQRTPDTKIYVRTVLPANRDFLKEDILVVNNLIKRYEEKGYYEVIDLYSQFVNDHGEMIKKLTNDGVHLSKKGYERWVKFEKQIVEKL